MSDSTPRYVEGPKFGRIFNGIIAWLARLGLSIRGSRVLQVRGRVSGEWRSVPVNLLVLDGQRYLVAPRGHTQWVRNLRAADGQGRLVLGRRVDAFTSTELPDDEKPPILKAYLKRWKPEVGALFPIGPEAGDDEFRRIAHDYPVFRLG